MIKIKLSRLGKKHHSAYRIIVAEAKSKRDGKNIDILGSYDPNFNPPRVNLEVKRYLEWINKGAKPTQTITKLTKPFLTKKSTKNPEK